MASISGMIITSRLNSAQPTAGQAYEMDAIAAVVLGGTSLSGGRGRIFGTLIGALIIGTLNNGLNLLGVSSFYQQIVKGIVIVIAVLLDRKNIKIGGSIMKKMFLLAAGVLVLSGCMTEFWGSVGAQKNDFT